MVQWKWLRPAYGINTKKCDISGDVAYTTTDTYSEKEDNNTNNESDPSSKQRCKSVNEVLVNE